MPPPLVSETILDRYLHSNRQTCYQTEQKSFYYNRVFALTSTNIILDNLPPCSWNDWIMRTCLASEFMLNERYRTKTPLCLPYTYNRRKNVSIDNKRTIEHYLFQIYTWKIFVPFSFVIKIRKQRNLKPSEFWSMKLEVWSQKFEIWR